MPVGEYTKEEIRRIAQEAGLPVAHKKDSQEICFVPDNDYAGFIEESTGKKLEEGNYVLEDGTVIGKHKGIIHYTIGQRKGLNLSMGHPVFVTEIRPDTNEFVIGENERFVCNRFNLRQSEIHGNRPSGRGKEFTAKIRYNHPGAVCTLGRLGEESKVLFREPQEQLLRDRQWSFYDGEYVASGGILGKA